MAVFSADFEAGVNGNTITTGAGEASATAWSTVEIDGSNTITYDSTYAAGGTLSGKLAEAGDSGGIGLHWSTGTLTAYYARLYARIGSNPSSELNNFLNGIRTGGTGFSWSMRIMTDGKIRLCDQAFTPVATMGTAVTTGDWFRLEWYINNSTGAYEVRLYNDAASGTLTDSFAGTGASFAADMNVIRYSVGPLNHTIWLDNIIFNATDWPGPAVEPSQLLAPSADSVDGAWTDQAGGGSLAAAIDEASASDTDYIRSELSPSNSGCRVKLGPGSDPNSSTGHTIHWRPGKSATGGETINMTVKLYEGGGNSQGAGTLIASFSRNNVDAFTTYSEALSGAEADNISDYTDLYLEFFATVA